MDRKHPFEIAAGVEVGSRRWPYSHAHPDCWGRPWKGIVLEHDDPRAWFGTIAFPDGVPSQADVTAHCERLRAEGYLSQRVPVLWDFGTHSKSYFEIPDSLRSYDEDVEAWEEARASAYNRCNKPAVAA